MSSTAPAYPCEREADVVLRDGATTHVRPVRADDAEAVHKFLEALSPNSIGYRFSGAPNLDWATQWSVDVEYADRFALVAESGNPRAIVAHALADVAGAHGISTFVAEVLPHNHRMIDVFRRSGFPVELHSVPGALEIELPTSLSAGAIERFEERERSGAVAAVKSFLEPRSVAVIEAHPEIVELDCNRVVAGPDGAVIVDARVRVEMAGPPRPMPSLEA